jgi:predicted nucleic acid-binding Zn ribbon protein
MTAATTKKVVQKLSENPKSSKYVAAHRHCVICHTPIPIDSDPAHCGAQPCSDKHARQDKSRKRLNLMMYLFPAIAIMLFLLPLFTT